MRVVHISISDRQGGASIAAFRLHEAMMQSGIDSIFIALNRVIKDREDIIPVFDNKFKLYFLRIVNILIDRWQGRRMHNSPGLFSTFKCGMSLSKHPAVQNADIIYLHWVCGGILNFTNLKKILSMEKSVYWEMHDMFPITGGCHYSLDCNKYKNGCWECQYSERMHSRIASRQFIKKKKIYAKFNNLEFIAPSTWLLECAKESGLTQNKQIHYIPYALPLDIFRPVNKTYAREVLGLEKK